MAKKLGTILTQRHLEILNEVLAMCRETREYCNKCSSAGLNVDPERRKNEEQEALATKLKAAFFPTAK